MSDEKTKPVITPDVESPDRQKELETAFEQAPAIIKEYITQINTDRTNCIEALNQKRTIIDFLLSEIKKK